MKALLIPVDGPVEEIDLTLGSGQLQQLQGLVGGYIQALPLPDEIEDAERSTVYINEEGKYVGDTRPNLRATVFMVPGIGLMAGDYVAGPMILCGFDPLVGENTDVPAAITERVRLIEREAAR